MPENSISLNSVNLQILTTSRFFNTASSLAAPCREELRSCVEFVSNHYGSLTTQEKNTTLDKLHQLDAPLRARGVSEAVEGYTISLLSGKMGITVQELLPPSTTLDNTRHSLGFLGFIENMQRQAAPVYDYDGPIR